MSITKRQEGAGECRADKYPARTNGELGTGGAAELRGDKGYHAHIQALL